MGYEFEDVKVLQLKGLHCGAMIAWAEAAFSFDDILLWLNYGFSLEEAIEWRQEGFSSEEAAIWKHYTA